MTSLRSNQICPLHRSKICCGRSQRPQKPKKYYYAHGVKRIPDITSPRGYREICSPAQLSERKDILLSRGEKCAACGKGFEDYRDVELAHKTSKGMDGSRREDHWSNICLMHKTENREQGSMTLERYLEWRRERGMEVPEGA